VINAPLTFLILLVLIQKCKSVLFCLILKFLKEYVVLYVGLKRFCCW